MKWPSRFKLRLHRHFLYRWLVLRPLRRWRWLVVERPMRFTRFGMFYVLFTLAVGAAAINTGNNLLYLILGIQLSFIIVSGFLSDSVLWGLRSRWQPAGDLFAGRLTHWTVDVRKGWFPAALIRVGAEWEQHRPQAVWLPWISGRQAATAIIELTPLRRGWIRLRRVRYSTAFPFGLFEKIHTESRSEQWLVFPRIVPLDLKRLMAQDGEGSNAPQVQRAGEGSVPWQVRDYRAGDALRRMDWKAVAKRQRLIVKETEEDTDLSPVLLVRSWPREERERFISFVASVIWSAAEQGRSLGLCTPDHYFPATSQGDSLRQMWRYLALIDVSDVQPRALPALPPHLIDAVQLWQNYRHDFGA